MEDIWTQKPGEASQEVVEDIGDIKVLEGISPLDGQTDVTERLCVPPDLREVLFGPLNGAQPATYAILDAAKIPNLPELLDASDLEHACLFQGDAFDELANVAPWIVKLEEDANLTRALFTFTEPDIAWEYWTNEPGLYLRSTATLDALRSHFRKFTKVRMADIPRSDQAAWQYFRFYEPEQAALYFEAIRAWPDRMAQFYHLNTGQTVDAIIAISSIARTAHVFGPAPRPQAQAPAFVFETRDANVFKSARRPHFRKELFDWLLRLDEPRFKPFSEDQLYALVDHGLREGDALKFTFKEEYVYLLYMMSYFGGWFHKSGRMPEISRIMVEDGRGRVPNLKKAFPATHKALFGNPRETYTGWAVLFGQMEAYLKKNGGWGGFTPKAARSLIATGTKQLGDEDRTRLAEFLTRVELDCDQREVRAPHARGIAVLLSYMLGHGFFTDPLYPWIPEIVAAHETLEESLPIVAQYSMKRGRKMLMDFQKGAA